MSEENSEYDLNSSLVNNALKALTPEQREHYKKLGESMYNNVKFEDSKILDNLPPPICESVAYISEGLKSGIHPSDLTTDELAVLKEAYGDHKVWLDMYDYTEDDLPKELPPNSPKDS